MGDLFTEVLALYKEAGLVKVGLIAIDGTKLHANASHHCNLDYEQIAAVAVAQRTLRVLGLAVGGVTSRRGDRAPGGRCAGAPVLGT